MFIEIEQLKPEPLHLYHEYAIGELVLGRDDASVADVVVLDAVLTHRERDLRVRGTVRTAVRYQCSRCLREVIRPLEARFDLPYAPHPEGAEDEEFELKYEDMDVGFYDGIRFDVDLLVLEQIELSVPMKFICREDCRGLCPGCGADLNEGQCRCAQGETDSRLAVLREFRSKMKN